MTQRRRRRNRQKTANMRNKKIWIISGVSLVAVAIVAFLIGYFVISNKVNSVPKDEIANNIYVEGIKASGMNAETIREELEAKVSTYYDEKVNLVADGAELEVTLKELGFQASNLDDVIEDAMSYGKKGSLMDRYSTLNQLEKTAKEYELTYVIDAEATKKVLEEKLPELENAAKEATIKRVDGKFVITEEQIGRQVDLEAAVTTIQNHFNEAWEHQGTETIELETKVEEPKLKKAELEKIKDQLGTFSTSFTSTSSRGKNIANAASRINGLVLMPGEVMSASDSMGSRTKENGYREAGAYLNGQTVQSLGGGVCQVSTTLYNAALLSELEITERHPHSMVVDYVPAAQDAAIAEGSKDLKIKNNTNAPIYVEGYTVGGRLTFTIYGEDNRSADRKITYKSEVTSRTDPKKKFVASDAALGTIKRTVAPHAGIKSKLWKIVTENGVEVSKDQVNSSNYMASAGTWSVGIATDNAEAKNIVSAAIATQDEAKINAAIAQAKAMIEAAQKPATPSTPTEPTTPTDPTTPTEPTTPTNPTTP